MKSTRRIKKLNGIEYWFEETPYYDTEKKQIRHKSKYLGRNIDGHPVRMRTASDEVKNAIKAIPGIKSSYECGSITLLDSIMKDLKLDRYLQDLVTESELMQIKALVFNRIIRPVAMKNIGTWYEGTALVLQNPPISFSGQRISELLAKLGDSNIPGTFMGKILAGLGTKSTLVYDITSLSSYSELINLLEYGYNRDGEPLPQLNFSLIVDQTLGIPVMYDIYPGSIVDVSTLSGTLKKIKAYGVHKFTAIMDRGFFSRGNLEELLDQNISFILPATLNLKDLKILMSESQRDIDDMKYLQKFKKESIHAKKIEFSFNSHSVNGYLYYDPVLEQREKATFRSRIFDVREKLIETHIPRYRKAAEVFKEKARDLEHYFSWVQNDDRFEIEIRQNAVAQAMNKMGKYILFYSGDFDWITCLSMYRERDVVEKGFRTLKTDIGTLPLNTHNDRTTRGFLFISFMSLIIRSRLLKKMKETGLLKRYSIHHLILELEKFRKVKLANGEIAMTEMTKKQREIFDALGLCA